MHKGIITIKIANVMGKNVFHVRYIKLSYRIRGMVARNQTNRVANNMVFITSDRFTRGVHPMKNTDVRRLIIRIFAYSAIKIRANMPPLYSTLNPDTSSDSPSAKSKGVRFVSARFVINQKSIIKGIITITQEFTLFTIKDISIFL